MLENVEENYKVKIWRCPKTGIVRSEMWKNSEGKVHRVGGPAIIERDHPEGKITEIAYRFNGKDHRENDLPAIEKFDPQTGVLVWQCWVVHGRLHRENGQPAAREFNRATGQLEWQRWAIDGKYAREGGKPHVEFYDEETGKLVRAEYRKNTTDYKFKRYKLHREDGPAVLHFDRETGEQIGVEYHVEGRKRRSLKTQFPTPSP